MRILIERSTLKALLVLFVLAIVCCVLGYCTTHLEAAPCTPLPVCQTSTPDPVTLKQSVGYDLGVVATPSLTLASPVMAGHTIIVAVRAGGASHSLMASDSLGNSYEALGTVAAPGPSVLVLFAAMSNTFGTVTVMVTDTGTPGAIRMLVREYSGLGVLSPAVVTNGNGLSVALGNTLAVVVTAAFQPTVVAAANVEAVNGKLFGLHGAASLGLSVSSAWTALTVPIAAASASCETPTPVIAWDSVADIDLAGYTLYYNEPGGVPQKIRDIPCEMRDHDGDGVAETRVCFGPDIWIALQREGNFIPGTAYEFYVKAYDAEGHISSHFSNVLPVCFRPLCVKPGPCS